MPNWAIVARVHDFEDFVGFHLQGLKVWKVPPPNRNPREATYAAVTQHEEMVLLEGMTSFAMVRRSTRSVVEKMFVSSRV